eukprot:693603_1
MYGSQIIDDEFIGQFVFKIIQSHDMVIGIDEASGNSENGRFHRCGSTWNYGYASGNGRLYSRNTERDHGAGYRGGDTITLNINMKAGTLSFAKNGTQYDTVRIQARRYKLAIYTERKGDSVELKKYDLTAKREEKGFNNPKVFASHNAFQISGDQITNISQSGGYYTMYGSQIIDDEFIGQFVFKIIQSHDMVIGIDEASGNSENGRFHRCGSTWNYGYASGNGRLYSRNTERDHGAGYRGGDTITLNINMKAGTLSFAKNGTQYDTVRIQARRYKLAIYTERNG